MTGSRKLATLCAMALAALASSVTDSLPRARAASEGAGEASRGTRPEAAVADPGHVELQRQVNELRSDLLDERERRIERQLEGNGAVLVVLAIVIGAGGLWFYTRFRAIAADARIGAALARAYVPDPEGLLPGAATSLPPPGERPGPLRLLGTPSRKPIRTPRPGPTAMPAPAPWRHRGRRPPLARSRRTASPARPVRQFPRPMTTSSGARMRSPTAPRRSASIPTLRRPTSAAATRSPNWGCTRRPRRTTTVSSSSTPTRPRHSWRGDPAPPEPPSRWDGTSAGPSTQPPPRDRPQDDAAARSHTPLRPT